jgi:hypothetical protein
VLVMQIDAVGSEALQGFLNHFLDVLRSAVKKKATLFIVEASKPNLVAIATLSRIGASASPTSSSFV